MNLSLKPFASEIREARLKKGLNQEQLAEKVGLTQAHLSRIERSEIDPRLSTLIELTRILGLEMVLVPTPLLPTINAVLRHADKAQAEDRPKQAYTLEEEEEE